MFGPKKLEENKKDNGNKEREMIGWNILIIAITFPSFLYSSSIFSFYLVSFKNITFQFIFNLDSQIQLLGIDINF